MDSSHFNIVSETEEGALSFRNELEVRTTEQALATLLGSVLLMAGG